MHLWKHKNKERKWPAARGEPKQWDRVGCRRTAQTCLKISKGALPHGHKVGMAAQRSWSSPQAEDEGNTEPHKDKACLEPKTATKIDTPTGHCHSSLDLKDTPLFRRKKEMVISSLASLRVASHLKQKPREVKTLARVGDTPHPPKTKTIPNKEDLEGSSVPLLSLSWGLFFVTHPVHS